MKNPNPLSLDEINDYFNMPEQSGDSSIGPYNVPPSKKTLKDCYNHGSDHRSYGWSHKVDHRWSYYQKLAYYDGFLGFDFLDYSNPE